MTVSTGEWRIVSWNVRGIPRSLASDFLCVAKREIDADVYLLQETGFWGDNEFIDGFRVFSSPKREANKVALSSERAMLW